MSPKTKKKKSSVVQPKFDAMSADIEKRLWQVADELRANSKLRSSEYSTPVLGLIFLRYASEKFAEAEKELERKKTGRREIGPTDYQARGVIYLSEASRFENLLKLPEGSDIGKAILFIDARNLFRQVDRAHRDFTPEQIEFIANIARLYRDEKPEFGNGSEAMLKEKFPSLKYEDIAGLSKVATLQDIQAQGWSLNPGRYVGVSERPADDFDFKVKLEELNEELEMLNAEARELETRIAENIPHLLETA